jgi:hypothetical protein
MSFAPLPPRPDLDYELARAKDQEIQRTAEQYARTHPEGSPRLHPMRRLWESVRGRRTARDD